MSLLMFSAFVVVVVVMAVLGDKPPETPCVEWIQWTSNNSFPLYINGMTWGRCDSPTFSTCSQHNGHGYFFPCFSEETNTVGHYSLGCSNSSCRTVRDGVVHFSDTFWLPRTQDISVDHYVSWSTQRVQSGEDVPSNAVRFGNYVVGQSLSAAPGCWMGGQFTGLAVVTANQQLGDLVISVADKPISFSDFLVATCEVTPSPPPPPSA